MQPTAIPDFLNDLRKHVDGEIRTDSYSLTLYSTDASIYQVKPYGVLIPKNVDDMQAAVELAAKYKVPVLPRAAGSSLAGQAVNEALVIDVTPHLDQILEVNTEERWVRVQSGVVLEKSCLAFVRLCGGGLALGESGTVRHPHRGDGNGCRWERAHLVPPRAPSWPRPRPRGCGARNPWGSLN